MYIANDLPSFVSLGPLDQALCRTPTWDPEDAKIEVGLVDWLTKTTNHPENWSRIGWLTKTANHPRNWSRIDWLIDTYIKWCINVCKESGYWACEWTSLSTIKGSQCPLMWPFVFCFVFSLKFSFHANLCVDSFIQLHKIANLCFCKKSLHPRALWPPDGA
jgi:hypothetical protein